MKPLPRMTLPWAAAYVLLALLALTLRLWNLSAPHALIFDETYYAKDAWALLHSGYERSWSEKANDLWLTGSDSGMLPEPAYVVHPPLGKWLIAGGLAVFGMDGAIGWRIVPALFGWMTVLLTAFTGRRLFRSNLWGLAAGFLLAIDGMHLVISRSALLDVFLPFFLLAAFLLLLTDKDWADKDDADARDRPEPGALSRLLWRPWRLLAGVCFGLALGVKWSALAFIAVFALMSWAWDARRRRLRGESRWALKTLLQDAPAAFAQTVLVAIPVYVSTWLGWIMTSGGYNRQWGAENPHPSWAPDWLASWWNYHESAYRFHNQLSAEHPYEANAYTWLFQGRPTSFYYQEYTLGQSGCESAKCSSAITDLGNPLIWWAGALSLVVVLLNWALRRDWRAGAVFLGVLAGLGPWFAFPERTMFTFYSVSFEPWLVLCLAYAMAVVWGAAQTPGTRKFAGVGLAAFFVSAAVLSAFFFPVWTAQVIDYSQWRLRMWFDTWI